MKRDAARKIQVFAVVRHDADAESPEFAFNIKEVLPSEDEAGKEAERLNSLNAERRCRYFVVMTRFYPDGLDAQ